MYEQMNFDVDLFDHLQHRVVVYMNENVLCVHYLENQDQDDDLMMAMVVQLIKEMQ
jgi:hypothetical protein